MEHHLKQPLTFVDVTEVPNLIPSIHKQIDDWAEKYGDYISPKIGKQLTSDRDRPGYNYGNYKAHKPEKGYPLRLITSGCGSPVKILSCFVDYHLKPLISDLNNVVIDISHFLRKLEKFNAEFDGSMDGVMLVTWDIENMFPSIDNDMGINACREALEKRLEADPPTDCVIDALKIVLENNISYFNNRIYKQDSGSAMGPNHSCSYSDNAIGPLDKRVNLYILTRALLLLWERFRDDIFGLWKGTYEELLSFTEWLNTLMPGIKFKLESYSYTSVNYLQVTVYKHENKLVTTRYEKPTDTHAYLLPKSCHPAHIARNIVFGVAVGCRRLCTLDSEFDKHSETLIKYFSDRGYDSEFTRSEFNRARLLDRESLFHKKLVEESSLLNCEESKTQKSDSRCFPLVATFNPNLPSVNMVLNKHKYILNIDKKVTDVINPDKIFASFRRNKSLGDMLVHSRYPSTQNNLSRGGCKKCDSGCTLCTYYLVETEKFTSYHTDKEFHFTHELTCQTTYIIYLINDLICKRSSVGRSENTLRSRWANHKSHIKRNAATCRVAQHYNELDTAHMWREGLIDVTLPKEINVTIIDCVVPEIWDTPDSLFDKLNRKEIYWQNQLRTLEEFGGLNDRDERRISQTRHSNK